jgi:hypothetical protein
MPPKAKQRGTVMDTKVAAKTENSTEEALQSTQESLDQVRDILFGSQLRDQDRRFHQIDEKVTAELGTFRDEIRKSVATLESFFKTELHALASRITVESSQRNDGVASLKNELAATSTALDKHLTQIDAQHAEAESDLRGLVADQSAAIREDLKATHAELSALVEKLAADLRGSKTDRATLANLFTEMAGRLQA